MSDSLDRLRAEFLAETEDTLSDLQKDLRSLEAASDRDSLPRDLLDRVFRTTHSLKGVAAMFGLDAMSSVAHSLESILDALRQKRLALDEELLELLFRGQAALHALLGTATTDDTAARSQSQEIIEHIARTLRGRLSRGDVFQQTLLRLREDEARAVASALDRGQTVALVEWETAADGFELRAHELLAAVRRWGIPLGTVTDAIDGADGKFVARTIAAGTGEIFGLIREVAPWGALVRMPLDGTMPVPSRAPATTTVSGETSPPRADRAGSPARGELVSIRVPIERIERLLLELGELAQTTTNLEETIGRSAAGDGRGRTERAIIRQVLRAMDRRIRSLHEGVLGVRKVALRGLFDRLERVFRDACRQSGKDARFLARGGETELDRSLVEALAEPLIHLVRNAVDHGLEEAATRNAAGKPERGTVRVEARAEGDRVVLELADDGKGVDHEGVLARARDLGFVAADEDPSVDERVALIFRAGLSVKDHATSLSGRGVGLDVVRESVVRFGGVLDVETGRSGTVFRLRLPRTLAGVAALEVETGGERYFIPLPNVARVLEIATGDSRAAAATALEVDGRTVEVRELVPDTAPAATRRRARPAILLAVADRRVLLLVDRVGRRRDIVVRRLGDLLGSIHGIAGCAETADGRSVLVLDPAALVEGPLAAIEVAP